MLPGLREKYKISHCARLLGGGAGPTFSMKGLSACFLSICILLTVREAPLSVWKIDNCFGIYILQAPIAYWIKRTNMS